MRGWSRGQEYPTVFITEHKTERTVCLSEHVQM